MRRLRAGALLLALACSRQEQEASPTASAPPSSSVLPKAASATSAAPSATSPEPAKPDSWFAGTWHGTYQAQRYEIEVPKNEGAREWKSDDGGTHSGEGKITLDVSVTGALRGTATGPLGPLVLSGEVDGETLRVRARPRDPGERAFHGFVLLTRQGGRLKGRLQAATGDSRTVRDAAVELSKGAAPVPAGSSAPAASGN